jgi:uncharacterized RDD family membrane protein YckC
LIDFAVVLALWVVAFVITAIVRAVSDTLANILVVLLYLPLGFVSLYFGYLEGETGQSPGKAVTGLKVVRQSDGGLIGGGQGIIRKLAHILDGICFIGYLFPLFDPLRQTFADKIMTTVVLRDQEKRPFSPELFGIKRGTPPAS